MFFRSDKKPKTNTLNEARKRKIEREKVEREKVERDYVLDIQF